MQTSRLQSPAEWGLPEEFDTFRPVQEDALHFIASSTKRVKALSAPTGCGKTIIGLVDALRHPNEPTCYVTENRALQDQICATGRTIGIVDLRGRSNYTCAAREDHTCEEGYATRCPYKGSHRCPASQAEMRAASSNFIVTNYDKWIHARKFGQGLAHVKRVIFDEAHETFSALARAMQITLHAREIHDVLGIDFPSPNDAQFFDIWRTWGAGARVVSEELMLKARAKVAMSTNPKSAWVKAYMHLRNLSRRLAILASASPNNWVVEELHNGYQFDPIQPARYAESALLLQVPDIIMMSATLRPKSLFMIGVAQSQFDFKEFESDFDPKRYPLYYSPITDPATGNSMKVDSKNTDLSMLWIRLDQIAARRQDRNGIVQSVSFLRRDEILTRSRFAGKMIINERGEPATRMVNEFKGSYPGSILVSPSVGQGFDFPGRAAEWQFIAKVPFPPPSRVMKARSDVDPEFPFHLTMQKLEQMVGRGMRSKPDQCENFISDANLVWFYNRYKHLATKNFRRLITPVSTPPAPPDRLPV